MVGLGQKNPGAHVDAAVDPAGQNWPDAQGVTVGAVGSGQKLPAGQALQLTLAVVLQGDAVYWPGRQTPQSIQTAALAVAENVRPVWHPAHTVFCDGAQGWLIKLPGLHTEQTSGAVTPCGQ